MVCMWASWRACGSHGMHVSLMARMWASWYAREPQSVHVGLMACMWASWYTWWLLPTNAFADLVTAAYHHVHQY